MRSRSQAVLVPIVLLLASCGQFENVHERSLAGSSEGGQGFAGTTTDGGLSAPGTTDGPFEPSGSSAIGPGTSSTGTVGGAGPSVSSTSAAYTGDIGVTKDSITLGFIYPRSGPYQALTTEFEYAVRMGMQAINDAGGIHGRTLQPVFADDGHNNASTALASAKSIKDRAFGMSTFGLLAGSVVSPYADEQRIPMIVGNVDRATVLNLEYVFPFSTYLETSVGILPSFIVNRLKKGDEKIAVLYQTTPQIAVLREHFRVAARPFGLDIVLEQPIEESPSTCTNQMSNIEDSEAKVVVIFTAPVPAIRCLLDARTLGYQPTWTGVGPSFNFEITNTGSGGLTNGIEMLGNSHTLERAAGKKYRAQAEKYYPDRGALPDDDLAFMMWGIINTWAEGLRRAGPNLTRDSWVRAMETFRGYTGGQFAPATFGRGDRSGANRTIVTKCVDGNWVTVDATWRTKY